MTHPDLPGVRKRAWQHAAGRDRIEEILAQHLANLRATEAKLRPDSANAEIAALMRERIRDVENELARSRKIGTSICPTCNGWGSADPENPSPTRPCETCAGLGRVPR